MKNLIPNGFYWIAYISAIIVINVLLRYVFPLFPRGLLTANLDNFGLQHLFLIWLIVTIADWWLLAMGVLLGALIVLSPLVAVVILAPIYVYKERQPRGFVGYVVFAIVTLLVIAGTLMLGGIAMSYCNHFGWC